VVRSLKIVVGENMHNDKLVIIFDQKNKPDIIIEIEPKFLYRYTYTRHEYNQVSIHCQEYLILKETEHGYWVSEGVYFGYGQSKEIHYIDIPKRFVRKGGIRVFARPTKKEALESLKRRCLKHLKIMESEKITVNNVLSKINQNEEKLISEI